MARIVFDLDGTLIDSAPDIRAAANRVLEERGLAPLTLDETHAFIGEGSPVFIARMRAARGIAESEQAPLFARFMGFYQGAVALTRLYPGVEAALTGLRASGHLLGLCTNKPLAATETVLAHFGLVFETVIAGDSLPERKPDPAPLHAAFAPLGDGPCLYVGDSETDAETAARAGVPFLLFTEGYRHVEVSALPHAAAFSDWAALPGLVAGQLAGEA